MHISKYRNHQVLTVPAHASLAQESVRICVRNGFNLPVIMWLKSEMKLYPVNGSEEGCQDTVILVKGIMRIKMPDVTHITAVAACELFAVFGNWHKINLKVWVNYYQKKKMHKFWGAFIMDPPSEKPQISGERPQMTPDPSIPELLTFTRHNQKAMTAW